MARKGGGRQPTCKSRAELQAMREAGGILAGALDALEGLLRPGVTTAELDRSTEEYIRAHGATPSFKGLYGYPATICCAPNDVVVHGIPDTTTVLREGDILGIDVGAEVRGMHADLTRTFAIGEVSERAKRLMEKTKEALAAGIAQAVEGAKVQDISRTIQEIVEGAGYSVIRDLTGHGIGRRFHEPPSIPNFVALSQFPEDYGVRLRRGMTLAIEPMVAEGAFRIVRDPDRWTYRTADGKLSAHFEHTVEVTRGAPRILTLPAGPGRDCEPRPEGSGAAGNGGYGS
ncbi:MAG: type I methionyl aminopeptidase [Armatimonadetes bacterium]|nr:type I methionyl aminopeptidase [Armatimonadota bacterium]